MQISGFRQNKTTARHCVISTLLVILLFIAPLSAFAQDKDTNSIDTLRRIGKAFAGIAEKASPAVVSIKAEKTVTQEYLTMPQWPFGERFDPFEDDFFDFFFHRRSPRRPSPRPKRRQLSQGSGFIVASDGYILTNNHVVGDADKVVVKLVNGREFTAKILGTDPETDVALLKIDANDLPSLQLADSDSLEVGEWVLAIGNPFGLSHTVTAGIVSAKGRSGLRLAEYEDFIQTDAAINPGNSGGPLINLDGNVVGINSAIIGPGGNVGIGFAIPVNMAKAVYDQLKKGEPVIRGFLGVGIQNLTPEFAEAFGLDKNTKGVLIPEVQKDSAAEKAGLKRNDIIVEFNGKPVETANQLQHRVATLKPGTKVKVVVLRDGKRETLTVKLAKRPSRDEIAGAPAESLKDLGLSVQALTDDIAERYGYQDLTGVVVTSVEPGSEAARKGIKPGMLIMEVNRKPIKNIKEFNKAISRAAKGMPILFLITDGQHARFLVLTLPGE